MALGGGSFTVENRALPGAYVNFVSAASASGTLSERGIAAVPLALDWGPDDTVFALESADFDRQCLPLLGYPAAHEKLAAVREVFKNARRLYTYKLGTGAKRAENEFAAARCTGVRGNDLSIEIAQADGGYIVRTLLAGETVDEQTAADAASLTENAFVTWKADAPLTPTAAAPLAGGANGTADAAAHGAFLQRLEAYRFNTLGTAADSAEIRALYTAFTRRMRDEQGVKFQTVLYREAADYPGVVNVYNKAAGGEAGALVYWVTGALAACPVNRSCQNRLYDGELAIELEQTQSELEEAIGAGRFVLHRVGDGARVLEDINSLVHETQEMGAVFRENQTVRVTDQIANDIAVLFRDKYLGLVPNDAAGRVSLWSDIVRHHEALAQMRAIEDFRDADVQVLAGSTKKSVVVRDAVTVQNAMSRLYMTVTVA